MIGSLLLDRERHGLNPVRLKEISVLHTRFLCAAVAGGERTPAAVLRRRLRFAGKRLLRQGVERVVLDAALSADWLPEGLRPVSTLPLRRVVAADWASELLRLKGAGPGAEVCVTANALTGEVVRTVTELALRQRYLLLEVPFGGEELCRRMRREYGVSVLLHPAPERKSGAALQVAFDPTEPQGGGFLPLYDETLPMPELLLPPEMERRLPEQLDRGQLLSALWESGAVRAGQLSVHLGAPEAVLTLDNP